MGDMARCAQGGTWTSDFSDDELLAFHAVAGDRAPPRKQVQELWIIAGRRAGKVSRLPVP